MKRKKAKPYKVSKAESIRRLRTLKRIMQRVERSGAAFDMDAWGYMPMSALRKEKGVDNTDSYIEAKVTRTPEHVGEHVCGFAGCALGWAAASPTMNKLGLYAVMDGCEWSPRANMEIHLRDTKHHDSLGAGRLFFGITRRQALNLFSPVRYPQVDVQPAHVIEHIDKVIKQVKARKVVR